MEIFRQAQKVTADVCVVYRIRVQRICGDAHKTAAGC